MVFDFLEEMAQFWVDISTSLNAVILPIFHKMNEPMIETLVDFFDTVPSFLKPFVAIVVDLVDKNFIPIKEMSFFSFLFGTALYIVILIGLIRLLYYVVEIILELIL